MKLKILFFLLYCILCKFIYANTNWEDFDNNLYFGAGLSINNSSIYQFGDMNSSSLFVNIGKTYLFTNNIYINMLASTNFLQQPQYASNWYTLQGKLGYAIQTTDFNFVPYATLTYGNSGAYYSSNTNFAYGIGLNSEVSLDEFVAISLDINYEFQNFSNINTDFNNNVITKIGNYTLNNNPTIINATLAVKYLTANGYYISPFFNYINYKQCFTATQSLINFGALCPNTNQYQIGINIGFII